GRSGEIPACVVLLRVGFTVPRSLLAARCALTAPFHPYPEPLADLPKQITNLGRYILCCTGRPAALTRPSRTLSGTLPCGVRTFLPRQTPAAETTSEDGSDHPAACLISLSQDVSHGANKTQSNCVEESRLSLALQGLRLIISKDSREDRAMEFKEAVKIALQSLWANKLRSVLTLLGVVIGVASVIAVVTLVNGANTYVTTKFSRYGADVFTVSKMPQIITSPEEYQK